MGLQGREAEQPAAPRSGEVGGGSALCPPTELEEPEKHVEVTCDLSLSPGHFSS